jgi:hypothetical protein
MQRAIHLFGRVEIRAGRAKLVAFQFGHFKRTGPDDAPACGVDLQRQREALFVRVPEDLGEGLDDVSSVCTSSLCTTTAYGGCFFGVASAGCFRGRCLDFGGLSTAAAKLSVTRFLPVLVARCDLAVLRCRSRSAAAAPFSMPLFLQTAAVSSSGSAIRRGVCLAASGFRTVPAAQFR